METVKKQENIRSAGPNQAKGKVSLICTEPERLKKAYVPNDFTNQNKTRTNQTIPEQTTLTFKALYDYTAADDEEISFVDGDVIVQVRPVDDEWYFGVVERTGASGVFPGNYVERI